MVMNTRLLAWIVAILLLSLVIASCSSKSEPPAQLQPSQSEAAPAKDGATLLSERCTACHSLNRIESAQKTQEEWKQTVDRMFGKGAVLSSQEEEILINYLATKYGP
jgi:cytochrome c5